MIGSIQVIDVVKEPPKVRTDGRDVVLVVCAWCYPNGTVFKDFPQLAPLRLRVSHGMCPICNNRLRRKVSVAC